MKHFDEKAAGWDEPKRVKLALKIARAVTERVRLDRGMDVLDFGCGTGLVSLPLSRRARSVTGVDTSAGMLKVFRGKLRGERFRNVRARRLRSASARIAGRYHGIVSSMTFHHVAGIPALLARLRRILRAGGWIAVIDLDSEGGRFHDHADGVFHHGFDRARLKKLFLEAGFTGIRVRTVAYVEKPAPDGKPRRFPAFLMTARLSAEG